MIRRPPRSTLSSSSAASDVYKRQAQYAVGNRIAVMVIVEEPAIVVAVAQRSLKIGEIHACSIVNESTGAGLVSPQRHGGSSWHLAISTWFKPPLKRRTFG